MAQLAQLQEQTRRLLELARAGDWEAASALEAERRPLLRSTFDPAAAPVTSEPYQRALREILDADREIMTLAAQRREDLRQQLQSVGQGKSAVRAYDQHRG